VPSGFAGGFDLSAACAVADCGDDLATLDLLDALVRKSLVVADRTSERTRFSMLETIRQFAEEQLVARGEASEIRAAHSRYFAGREADIMALWDSPRQREAYDWFTTELANLRTAFRWAADQGDLDTAAVVATYAGFFGIGNEKYEPIGWAEELIEPASAVNHPRLAFLYVIASQCFMAGRVDDVVRYCDEGQIVFGRTRTVLPYGIEGVLGTAYVFVGQPDQWVAACRAALQRRGDAPVFTRVCLIYVLMFAGRREEAIIAADGLIETAEATRNPWAVWNSLLAYGAAFRDADPGRALDAFRRGLVVAQDSGSRFSELAASLARQEALQGDTASAFDHVALAVHSYHDSGNNTLTRQPLALLAFLLDQLGRHEPAATIAGFVRSVPGTALAVPEITTAITHLRKVLGEPAYESLAHKGATMTTAAMATYAYDQIDQARTTLEQPIDSLDQ